MTNLKNKKSALPLRCFLNLARKSFQSPEFPEQLYPRRGAWGWWLTLYSFWWPHLPPLSVGPGVAFRCPLPCSVAQLGYPSAAHCWKTAWLESTPVLWPLLPYPGETSPSGCLILRSFCCRRNHGCPEKRLRTTWSQS